jgi:hypothetical protein
VTRRHLTRASAPRGIGRRPRSGDIADLLRAAVAVTALVAAADGDRAATIKCVLLLVPALASRLVAVAPAWQIAFNLALLVEAVGSAEGFNGVRGWNTVAHLVLPFLSGPFLACALARLGLRADADAAGVVAARSAVGIVTFASVLAIGAFWELLEWAVDARFGTHFAISYTDTVMDLLHDALAGLASGHVVALRTDAVAPDSG